ncbi:hypothetical protein TSOC_006105, partial [Tetrabaena socialis]
VKKKVGGGKRYKAVASAKAQGLAEPKWDGPAPPLHVQKKLTRKVHFMDSECRTAPHKSARKKALPDLSTLGAVLDEVAQRKGAAKGQAGDKDQKQRGSAVNSAKQRGHILLEESQRMKQVLRHPLYKQDPIAAITNHLQHTLPPVPPLKKPTQKAGAGKGKRGKGKQAGAMEE